MGVDDKYQVKILFLPIKCWTQLVPAGAKVLHPPLPLGSCILVVCEASTYCHIAGCFTC